MLAEPVLYAFKSNMKMRHSHLYGIFVQALQQNVYTVTELSYLHSSH